VRLLYSNSYAYFNAEMLAKRQSKYSRSGKGYRVNCPLCNDKKQCLSLSDGHDGKLLVHCFKGCDSISILKLLSDQFPQETYTQRPTPTPESSDGLNWSSKAEYIWNQGLPIKDTPVETYLRSRKVIVPYDCEDLRYIPPSIKYPPTMCARLTDAVTALPVSLHFTRLKPDGTGKNENGIARLYLSHHRKTGTVLRLTEDAEVTLGLGIAEGIETALSVLKSGFAPIWACLDAGNIKSFPVLNGLDCLTIFADHDQAGRDAADTCAKRWRAAGKDAAIVLPERLNSDWNDYEVSKNESV